MKEGLIPSRYECPKLKKDMRLVERKGTIDGFEWRCRVQSKENPHFVCRSAGRLRSYVRDYNILATLATQVGVIWRFELWGFSSGVFVTSPKFKIMESDTNSPRVAFNSDADIKSK
ncbi:uncharacterized protein TNCV_3938411 [Trichonephila clavipes]|nr:uncharacterized protein TNCV_3938411 [Trichonephila clavipes]